MSDEELRSLNDELISVMDSNAEGGGAVDGGCSGLVANHPMNVGDDDVCDRPPASDTVVVDVGEAQVLGDAQVAASVRNTATGAPPHAIADDALLLPKTPTAAPPRVPHLSPLASGCSSSLRDELPTARPQAPTPRGTFQPSSRVVPPHQGIVPSTRAPPPPLQGPKPCSSGPSLDRQRRLPQRNAPSADTGRGRCVGVAARRTTATCDVVDFSDFSDDDDHAPPPPPAADSDVDDSL